MTIKSFEKEDNQRDPKEEKITLKNAKYNLGSQIQISAKQMRDLLLMKYFECDRIPLSHRSPYKVKWNNIRIRFLFDEVLCSMALYSLNGVLVGLCSDPSKYKLVCSQKSTEINDLHPKFLSSTPICECIGLGIIRAIDPSQHLFYITTPVPLKDLVRVNTIMKGEIEIPTLALLEGGVMNAPYLCSNALAITDGSGAAPMNKKRQNVPRKGNQ